MLRPFFFVRRAKLQRNMSFGGETCERTSAGRGMVSDATDGPNWIYGVPVKTTSSLGCAPRLLKSMAAFYCRRGLAEYVTQIPATLPTLLVFQTKAHRFLLTETTPANTTDKKYNRDRSYNYRSLLKNDLHFDSMLQLEIQRF